MVWDSPGGSDSRPSGCGRRERDAGNHRHRRAACFLAVEEGRKPVAQRAVLDRKRAAAGIGVRFAGQGGSRR